MKKFNLKSFLGGVLVTVLAMSFTITALGDSKYITETFSVNSVNISFNGKTMVKVGENYKLSNGTEVPSSIMAYGTTYVPLRKFGDLADKKVTWKAKTQTAGINDKNWKDPFIGAMSYKDFRAMWEIETKPWQEWTEPSYIPNAKHFYSYYANYVGDICDYDELKDYRRSIDSLVWDEYTRKMANELRDELKQNVSLDMQFKSQPISSMDCDPIY